MYIKDEAYKAKEENLAQTGKLTGTLTSSIYEEDKVKFGDEVVKQDQ